MVVVVVVGAGRRGGWEEEERAGERKMGLRCTGTRMFALGRAGVSNERGNIAPSGGRAGTIAHSTNKIACTSSKIQSLTCDMMEKEYSARLGKYAPKLFSEDYKAFHVFKEPLR